MIKISVGVFVAFMMPIGVTGAQRLPAPIGHRQPSAADVPSNDSMRGIRTADVQSTNKPESRRRRPIDLDVPNICWNCNK